MANAEVLEDTRKRIAESGPVELLIGVTGTVNLEELRYRAAGALAAVARKATNGTIVVTWPDVEDANQELPNDEPFALLPYSLAGRENESGPYAQISAAQRGVLALAAELNAAACLVLNADLAALHGEAVQALSYPILEKQCDLITPIYSSRRHEGLLNTGILAPLIRALYGKRLQYPLPFDFAVSARYSARIAGSKAGGILWPLDAAIPEPAQIGQVHLNTHHDPAAEGLELTAVLSQIVGSLFLQVEQYAPYWQRTRGSQPTAVWGEPQAALADSEAVDVRPMVESFQLAARNLDELWSLVLPPVTLLELKRIGRSAPEQFRMPDALWARIVYDFALAHRLRTISRTHLMGALTPLYLGWVASYVQEIATVDAAAVGQRKEELARAFEENKPYLVSRWRWPDRFNP